MTPNAWIAVGVVTLLGVMAGIAWWAVSVLAGDDGPTILRGPWGQSDNSDDLC